MGGWSLAIDFGTTNTAAAYRLAGSRPQPVRLSDQADLMPSAVFLDGGQIKVGVEATRLARADPSRFEACPKRRFADTVIQLGGWEVPVTVLVGAVLAHVARKAQRQAGGEPPSTVLLTHPQDWARPRQDMLRQAAHHAGFTDAQIRLVPEPIAAAVHYSVEHPVRPGEVVAVFDFGGGTCDVAVLLSTANPAQPFAVLAAGGEDPLGGEDFDAALLAWTLRHLDDGHPDLAAKLRDPANLAAKLTLRDQVRDAKHALSDYEQTTITVAVEGQHVPLAITREEFTGLIQNDIASATRLLARTLSRAGVVPAQLTRLYLTGGSTHIPAVSNATTSVTGRPPATLRDPKLVTALGALDTVPDVPEARRPEPAGPGHPKASRAAYRWVSIIGLVVIVALVLLTWWLVPGGSNDDGGGGLGDGTTSSTTTTPSTITVNRFSFAQAAEPAAVTDCAAVSSGQVQEWFQTNGCVQVSRGLYSTSEGDAQALVSVVMVTLSSAEQAAEFKQLVDGFDTGNVTTLVDDGTVQIPGAPNFAAGAYGSEANDVQVAIAMAGYLQGTGGGSTLMSPQSLQDEPDPWLSEIVNEALQLAGYLP